MSESAVPDRRRPALRRSEWVLAGYFLYVALLGAWRTGSFFQPSSLALIIPLTLVLLTRADSRSTHRGWSYARDWIPALLVLVAYWSIDAVTREHGDWAFENQLVGWDRTLLNDWKLRWAIERFGAVIPAMLELAYSLLYVVLPVTIAGFYLQHKRDRLDDFMFPFLLGTLATYAMLPHFPSEPPRVVFDGYDSVVDTPFRRFNLWILNHGDIRSSVFPSGHVAVGFSAAFAMWLAVPERRVLGWTLMALAMLVWVCTIYGRYHYAADGLASAAIAASAAIVLRGHRARSGTRPADPRL